jgi:hypothetical protein
VRSYERAFISGKYLSDEAGSFDMPQVQKTFIPFKYASLLAQLKQAAKTCDLTATLCMVKRTRAQRTVYTVQPARLQACIR